MVPVSPEEGSVVVAEGVVDGEGTIVEENDDGAVVVGMCCSPAGCIPRDSPSIASIAIVCPPSALNSGFPPGC